MESKLLRMGGLVGLAILFAACAGKVHNLGDEGSAGAGADAGGRSTTAEKGGAGGKGSGTTKPKGGAGGGGTTATGTSAGNIAYPLAPTLPIDPNCSCLSGTQICNAAGKCVDRCESSGVCAKWLTSSSVTAMYAEGSTLYFATAPTMDPVGNPGKNGSLYRVETPGGTPTKVATGLQKVTRILGRYAGATYLEIQSTSALGLYRASDTGEVSVLDADAGYNNDASMRDKWLVHTNWDRSRLSLIELDGALAPSTLVTLATTSTEPGLTPTIQQPQVLSHSIWYGTTFPYQGCNIDLLNLTQEPTCSPKVSAQAPSATVVGTSEDTLYIQHYSSPLSVNSYSSDGTLLLKLAYGDGTSDDFSACYATKLSQGWLYSWLFGGREGDPTKAVRLVRYPTSVGRIPQLVISAASATPSLVRMQGDGSLGYTSNIDELFAVTPAGVFWVQESAAPNQGQYIFHAPLPPQPCDSELPCADATQVCTSGFCASP